MQASDTRRRLRGWIGRLGAVAALAALASGCGRSSVALPAWGTGSGGDVEGSAPNDCQGEPSDVLGVWRLDAIQAGNTPDAGPLSNDAELFRAVPVEDGASGSALHFDGDAHATVRGPGLEPSGGVSLTAWARPAELDAESWNSIVSKGAEEGTLDRYWLGYYRFGLRMHVSDGAECFSLEDGADYRAHVGQWHHLAATFDADSGDMTLYVDGMPTARETGGPERLIYDGAPLRIGADTNRGQPRLGFVGDLDEIKVLGCRLTPAQVAADASRGWPFD